MNETKRICVYCGTDITGRELAHCCGEVGHFHEVHLQSLPLRRINATMNEVEISSTDFDTALAEAEELVRNINKRDFMLSPSIVSRTRDAAGMWRFVVRTWGLD